MARRIPADRFTRLVRVATDVFIAQGYRRTQMADIAAALGVAKGSLYSYVESKETLFQLALRHADDRQAIELPEELPLPTPGPGDLTREFRARFRQQGGLPLLAEALERGRPGRNLRVELEGILRELYGLLERYHRGIKLIDRCALDHPELSDEWQKAGREGTRAALERYLEARRRNRQLRPIHDLSVTARLVIETITTWTVHIKWDRFPQHFDEKAVADAVVGMLLHGLLRDPVS